MPILRTLAIAALLAFSFATSAGATTSPTYTQIGHNIIVAPGQQAGDVTCIGCSIYVRGQVTGDATTVGGSILIEDQGEVAGGVTSVAGDVRLEDHVKVAGDLTVVGGEIRRAPDAEVSGDVTAVGGRAWGMLALLLPFALLGLLIALIVWLVQSARRRSAFDAHAAHQRLVPNVLRTPSDM